MYFCPCNFSFIFNQAVASELSAERRWMFVSATLGAEAAEP